MLDEIEKRLLLPVGSLELPKSFTLPRYDSDGVIHTEEDPNYRSNPEYVPEIDPTYVMQVEQATLALIACESGVPTQAYGVSGSGKTTFWEQFAGRLGRELRVIQCLKGMTEKTLLGKQDFVSDEKGTRTPFALGPLPSYISYPGAIVLLDEQDVLDDAVGFVLQPLLKRGGVLRISELGDNGNIYPAENVWVVSTTNTVNGVDETGTYTRTLQDASQVDRFLCKIPFPPPDERKILKGKWGEFLADETIDALVRFAHGFRQSPELQSNLFSTRRLVFIGEIAAKYGSTELALRTALFNELPAGPLRETARNLAIHENLARPEVG